MLEKVHNLDCVCVRRIYIRNQRLLCDTCFSLVTDFSSKRIRTTYEYVRVRTSTCSYAESAGHLLVCPPRNSSMRICHYLKRTLNKEPFVSISLTLTLTLTKTFARANVESLGPGAYRISRPGDRRFGRRRLTQN